LTVTVYQHFVDFLQLFANSNDQERTGIVRKKRQVRN